MKPTDSDPNAMPRSTSDGADVIKPALPLSPQQHADQLQADISAVEQLPLAGVSVEVAETNRQLVLSMLRAHADAERARGASLQREERTQPPAASTDEEARRSADLVSINEQLVLAALRAHAEAEVAEQRLSLVTRAAELDPLTQLPNRALLRERFDGALAEAQRTDGKLAILFLDLDRFKPINDNYGHAVGDHLLKNAARCISHAVRASDTVSRYGGDEFVVLLTEVDLLDDVSAVARKIVTALNLPRRINDHFLRMSASIGISVYPDDGADLDMLIEQADAALYRAKAMGRGQIVFHTEVPSSLPASAAGGALQRSRDRPTGGDPVLERDRRAAYRRDADEQLVVAMIDAQQLQQAAQRAQRRQTEFLAVMAHEQRNALGPLRNAAALLERLDDGKPLLTRVQAIIARQVDSLTRLVDDALDLTGVTTGKLRLELQQLDLRHAIDIAVEAMMPAIDTRTQQLILRLPEPPVYIRGDSLRVAQILGNLLDNASKYTPAGGTITLTMQCEEERVTVQVIDTGMGITAEALDHIFELFAQDSHTEAMGAEGFGIGLAVVRELCQAHGGSVMAQSDGPGCGTTLTVTLPLAHVGAAVPAPVADHGR